MKTCFVMLLFTTHSIHADAQKKNSPAIYTVSYETLAKQLGWVPDAKSNCGGYYLEPPFIYPIQSQQDVIESTGDQGLFSFRGTSILEGKVTITRAGQQITANKAYLYRNPSTGKLSMVEMVGDVRLREPNILIVGKKGRYHFDTNTKSLIDILYRTTLINKKSSSLKKPTPEAIQHERKITSMTAWGKAYEFSQAKPNIFELSRASFTTCPPIRPAWRLKASHIVLNKNTGRAYASNARLLVKNIPILYMPYLNFSIDKQRKNGFLWPIIGSSNTSGLTLSAPFYWNMAPNYDMTMTPTWFAKRGYQLSDNFRYLTESSSGKLNIGVLPDDRYFQHSQTKAREQLPTVSDSIQQAELNRLINDSPTRKGWLWRSDAQFNEHWSNHIDFNYAGDDYYLRDFGSLNEITANQLLQEGDLYYKGENWNFTGRVQAYQTLHPTDETNVLNQYRRFPQLILKGDYPNQFLGLEYFIENEITHFEILKTPGTTQELSMGNRMNIQPGVSLPLTWTAFYIIPRAQLAMTQYQLYQIADTNTPASKRRVLPIVDVASGLSFNRDTILFNHAFQQTMEPQVYYTYIPYRNQASIPIFDTTVNTLTYDQIFNYNRFTGLDRIGDANQIGVGVTTRLIDTHSGIEKIRLGAGEILYFTSRLVTLCNDDSCTDNPQNHLNKQRFSPLSGVLDYHMNDQWKLSGDAIWDPVTKQIDNATVGLHYQPDDFRIINLGFSYALNGDIFSGITVNNSQNNLKLTDISFAWPIVHDVSMVGRWSQDWNQERLQNLLYGVQYDTCCWAVRLVGGRAFTNLLNNSPQYKNEVYIQFALKGIGDIGSGNPQGLLNTITGYKSQFGEVM
ncbi:MAG TPA: LPS assembly protein LptD [Gammaproteobacteria bacterium]|nr:LPS assembly protein LptD [Gammaproteobacteria bacterium]